LDDGVFEKGLIASQVEQKVLLRGTMQLSSFLPHCFCHESALLSCFPAGFLLLNPTATLGFR
jgi:hypothetical protein